MNNIRYRWRFTGLLLVVCLSVAAGAALNLRIAHTFEPSIDGAYVKRVAASNYTHIAAEFNLHVYASDFNTTNGSYTGTGLGDRLEELFELVDEHGMRLIPEFQTGSRWSAAWGRINHNILYCEPNPPSTTPYVDRLPEFSPHSGRARSAAATSITLATTASSINDNYKAYYVGITAGTGAGQWRMIAGYNGTTKVATLRSNEPWSTTPDGTSDYRIIMGYYSPAFANNPQFDNTFENVMQVVADAFSSATLSPDYTQLDYIYLGHDESTTSPLHNILAPGRSRADARWIYDNVSRHGGITRTGSSGSYQYQGVPTVEAVVELMAWEISERVAQVQGVSGLGDTKVLIMADMWDPQHNGRASTTVTNAPFGTSALLSYSFPSNVTDNLLLLPWIYTENVHYGQYYDEVAAYDAFRASDFDFLPIYSLADPIVGYHNFTEERINRARKNIAAMGPKNGNPGACGFLVTAWDSWDASNPHEGFKTIEYLAYWTGYDRPKRPTTTIILPDPGASVAGPVQRLAVDRTEVTQGDYLAIENRHPFEYLGVLERPAENVTWYDAILYCNARSEMEGLQPVYSYDEPGAGKFDTDGSCIGLDQLDADMSKNGYRLPTVEEWEYIYRAGTTTTYYWGEAFDEATVSQYAWYDANSSGSTHPVMRKTSNAWGMHDIAGNVFEWVWNDRGDTYAHVIGGCYQDGWGVQYLTYMPFETRKRYALDNTGFRVVRKSYDITPILNLLLLD